MFIYLAEAHADDVWPLGYGINSANTIEERQTNCDSYLQKYPDFKDQLDAVFLDNMENDFNETAGAWPEAYYFADKDGKALWRSTLDQFGVLGSMDIFHKA